MPDPAPGPARAAGPRGLDPRVRRRIAPAAGSLLAVVASSIGVIGALTIWHLVRRGRILRERLGPPRAVRWPAADESHPPETAQ